MSVVIIPLKKSLVLNKEAMNTKAQRKIKRTWKVQLNKNSEIHTSGLILPSGNLASVSVPLFDVLHLKVDPPSGFLTNGIKH